MPVLGRFLPLGPPQLAASFFFLSILQLGTHGCGRRWPFSVWLSRRGLALPRPLLSWSFGRAGALPAHLPNYLPDCPAATARNTPPVSGVGFVREALDLASRWLPRPVYWIARPEGRGPDLISATHVQAAQRHARQEAGGLACRGAAVELAGPSQRCTGGKAAEVARVRITAAGRMALADEGCEIP